MRNYTSKLPVNFIKANILLPYILILVTLGSGCASFSHGRIIGRNFKKLTSNNLNQLTGTYSFLPDFSYDKRGNPKNITRDSKKDYFYQYVAKKEINIDSADKYFNRT